MAWIVALALAAQAAGVQDVPPAQMQALLQSCDAHKFETTIHVTVAGKPKQSKVKLCGTEGQSDADWLRTLKDAVAKTAANGEMPRPVRDQVVAALNAEIARLNGQLAGVVPITGSPLGRGTKPATPLSRDYAVLPPLPAPRPATKPKAPLSRDYATYAPLPPALPPAATAAVTAALPVLSKPRMTMLCLNSTDIAGEGPCAAFERDTLVTIRAGEDLPAGTGVRFVRGNATADVALAQLRRGKSMRFALPREVCAGVGGGKLEVQIVRTPAGPASSIQIVGSEGSFNLRC